MSKITFCDIAGQYSICEDLLIEDLKNDMSGDINKKQLIEYIEKTY